MARSEENYDGFNEEEQHLWRTTVKTGDDMARIFRMRDERRRREDEEELKEQWPSTEAAWLFKQLAETFMACQKLVEQDATIQKAAKLADGERLDVFTMLRDNLEKANQAPRCEYMKSNGRLCRAPKMRGQKYCCMHLAMERRGRRSSACRRWTIRMRSRWRSRRARKGWWTARWKKSERHGWRIFCNWQ